MAADQMHDIRKGVLDQMERAERNFRLGIAGAAVAEMALIVLAFTLVDMGNRVERLVFLLSILSYTIIVLGLVALGAHITRTVSRVLMAMSSSGAA